jgi:hypothetical protein
MAASRALPSPNDRLPARMLSPLASVGGIAALAAVREAASAVSSGLSFAAELVRQGRGEEPAASDAIPADTAYTRFSASLQQFAERLRQRLSQVGVDLTNALELTADGLGGIDAQGPEPDRAALEQLLASDESLRRDFTDLASEHADLSGQSRHDFGLLLAPDSVELLAE